MDTISFLTVTPLRLYEYIFPIFIFAFGVLIYFEKGGIFKKIFSVKKIVLFFIGIQIVYALFLTVGQYYVWAVNESTRIFITSPFDSSLHTQIFSILPFLKESPLGYFMYYIWGRFWMRFVIVWCIALGVWVFFSFIRKKREYLLEKNELLLGILGILTVGWPGVVIFFPLTFLIMILMSFFKFLFKNRELTTLDSAFIIAGFITLFFGAAILNVLGLGILRI